METAPIGVLLWQRTKESPRFGVEDQDDGRWLMFVQVGTGNGGPRFVQTIKETWVECIKSLTEQVRELTADVVDNLEDLLNQVGAIKRGSAKA